MRKITIIGLLLMLLLAACGGNPTPAATEEAVVTEEATAETVEETEAVEEATEVAEEATEATVEETEVAEEATEAVVTEEATEAAVETVEETEAAVEETEVAEEATEAVVTEEATEVVVTEEATQEVATEEATEAAAETPSEEGTEEVLPEATAVPEGTEEPAAIAPWVCPEGYAGQSLNVYNWSTYIAEDTIPNFEAACGVTVTYDTFENNEAVLTRLQQGNPGYDIIVPTDYMIATMIRENLLIPLDKSRIPNIANLNPNLMNQPYDPDNVYSVPYQWGTIGVGYNTTAFPDGIDSWTDLWNHQGSVAWLDDRRGMIGIALKILGYDPNSVTESEILEAKDYLIANGSNVTNVAGDDGQELLARGDVDATVEYNGDILALAAECACDTYAYVVPSEAAVLWVDNLAVPVGAANPDLAMVFIDYVLHPQVAADISNYTSYASPNQAAIDLGLILEGDNPAIYPSAETQQNLFTYNVLPPEAEVFYNDAWDEILISLGGS